MSSPRTSSISPASSAAEPRAPGAGVLARRLGRILGAGNLIGAVVAFPYSCFVDIAARPGPLDRGEVVYSRATSTGGLIALA